MGCFIWNSFSILYFICPSFTETIRFACHCWLAMIIGGLALSFIHPPWQIDAKSLTLETYLYLVAAIIFGTMLAFWFYIESLQSLSPKETSFLGSIEPLAAVLTTVFWLKEPFGFFQWVGTACIISMILLLALVKDSSSKTNKVSKNEKPVRIS
ncbi:EamA family transporter [Bacillus lumedeiriae]|uniref:EamA family transporter n=1 Tax=Bacillus lumedeiriae TaxID=3058829 RepID=UPI00384D8D16